MDSSIHTSNTKIKTEHMSDNEEDSCSGYDNLIIKEESVSENEADENTSLQESSLIIKTEHSGATDEREPVDSSNNDSSLCTEQPSEKTPRITENGGDSTGQPLFRCILCPYETSDETYLVIHKKTHRKKFRCDSCRYWCGREYKLLYHQKKRHTSLKDLVMHCIDCDFTSLTKVGLRNHRREQHKRRTGSSVDPKLQCPDCPYETANKNSLKRHQAMKHQPFVYRCSCGNLFPEESEYDKHVSLHAYEKTEDGKLLKCMLCDFRSKTRFAMIRHDKTTHKMTEHLITFRYSCDLCPFKSDSSGGLYTHRRYHKHKDQTVES